MKSKLGRLIEELEQCYDALLENCESTEKTLGRAIALQEKMIKNNEKMIKNNETLLRLIDQ